VEGQRYGLRGIENIDQGRIIAGVLTTLLQYFEMESPGFGLVSFIRIKKKIDFACQAANKV